MAEETQKLPESGEQKKPAAKLKRPAVVRLTDALLPGCAEIEQLCFHSPWSVTSLKLLTGGIGTGYAILSTSGQAVNEQSVDGQGDRQVNKQPARKVVAYGGMLYAADEGQITNIGVRPAYRRMGFGRAITDALLRDAWDAGMESVTLEVRESNLAALTMYRAFGFAEVGRRPHFYDHPDETAILLTVTRKQYEAARRARSAPRKKGSV